MKAKLIIISSVFTMLLGTAFAQFLRANEPLNSGYQLIQLEQDPASHNILFPATINEKPVALFLSTNSGPLLLDKTFAEKLEIKFSRIREQPLAASLGSPHPDDLNRARIQQLVTGQGKAARLDRYPDIRVADLGPRMKVTKKGKIIQMSGYLGLDFLNRVGPVIDFHHKVLALPQSEQSSGAYAYRQAQAGAIPTTIIRDSKSGQYFIILTIQRKQYAFQIDLNRRDHQIIPLIAKQLNLKTTEQNGSTLANLENVSLATFELAPLKLNLQDLQTTSPRIGGFRLAGVLGLPFFSENRLILDFGGPLAVVPQP